jgi:hypothetical protein
MLGLSPSAIGLDWISLANLLVVAVVVVVHF